MLVILVCDIHLMMSFSNTFADRYFLDLLAALVAPQQDKGSFTFLLLLYRLLIHKK